MTRRAGFCALLLAAFLRTGPAAGDSVTVTEFPPGSQPFARLTLVNHCGDAKRVQTVTTSRGPVTVRFVENGNACFKQPDTFLIDDLPAGVSADPLSVDLIERIADGRSPPGHIDLYSFEGM